MNYIKLNGANVQSDITTIKSNAYRASVNTFVSVVDDRDKYKGDMEALKKRKENIKSICDSTKVFVDHWNDVLNDVQKINYERKVAVTV